MKRLKGLSGIFILLALFAASCSKEKPKTITDAVSFEEIVLNDAGIYNGSDGSKGFTSGNLVFKTDYNPDYSFWTGFAVCNHTDSITSGYSNQFSSVTGSGSGLSTQYAVLYSFSEDTIELLHPAKVTNIAISNTTYAYYSMKNGDQFAKKFGGTDGNDPDYFYLYLSAVTTKGERIDFNPIPLADYTFSDNSQDFISRKWENYNLESVGVIKYLIFSFDSSDKSEYGINTPTYVCIDNIVDEWEE